MRWLRRPDDVSALARTQAGLLDALWPLLKPGGRLVFATCSLFKAEGQDQIDAFLQRQGGHAAMLDPASPGHLLPLPDNGAEPARRAPARWRTASSTPSFTRPEPPPRHDAPPDAPPKFAAGPGAHGRAGAPGWPRRRLRRRRKASS